MRGALGVIKTKSCQAGYTLRKLDVQLLVPTALVQNLYQFFSTHLSNNSSNVDAFPRFFFSFDYSLWWYSLNKNFIKCKEMSNEKLVQMTSNFVQFSECVFGLSYQSCLSILPTSTILKSNLKQVAKFLGL